MTEKILRVNDVELRVVNGEVQAFVDGKKCVKIPDQELVCRMAEIEFDEPLSSQFQTNPSISIWARFRYWLLR